MHTVVITGGTDGIGKALALRYLHRGARALIVGSNAGKGRAVLDAAAELGARDRIEFLRADLSLVADNRQVIDRVTAMYPVIDTLVFGARYYRSQRHVTTEGFEANFALFYLSRYLLGHGLQPLLNKAETPVLLDLCGPGGDLTRIRWDDLQFAHSYEPDAVMHQCGKLSDLLAVDFVRRYSHSRTRYLLLHPGLTATGFTGEYSAADAELVHGMRERGQSAEQAVDRILHHLDAPPSAPLTAYMQDTLVDVAEEPFDPVAADRLATHTRELLARTTAPHS